jgi:hypothetical protein
MGHNNRQSPALQMHKQPLRHDIGRSLVERGKRLVEQP